MLLALQAEGVQVKLLQENQPCLSIHEMRFPFAAEQQAFASMPLVELSDLQIWYHASRKT